MAIEQATQQPIWMSKLRNSPLSHHKISQGGQPSGLHHTRKQSHSVSSSLNQMASSSPHPIGLGVPRASSSKLALDFQIPEQDQDSNNMITTTSDNKSHVKPVMGIFFKVWSLVKVTKMKSHHRVRRQNSEEASNFHYIPGEQMAHSDRSAPSPPIGSNARRPLLASASMRQFRRAGSQPVSGEQPQSSLVLANSCANTSTSSGVSSSSASSTVAPSPATVLTLDGGSPNSLDGPSKVGRNDTQHPLVRRSVTTSFQHPKPGYPAQNDAKNSYSADVPPSSRYKNTNNMRRISWCESDDGLGLDDRDSVDENNITHINGSHVDYDPENDSRDNFDEKTSNDIYSTPADSVQSVMNNPTGSNIFSSAAPSNCSGSSRMIKSFSTNNFGQLTRQLSLTSCGTQDPPERLHKRNESHIKFEPQLGSTREQERQIGPDSKVPQTEAQSRKRLSETSASRFFISSSSSDDSATQNTQKQASIEQKIQLVLQKSVHYHNSASRPDTLNLGTSIGQQVPNSFTPIGGPPLKLLDRRPSIGLNKRLQSSGGALIDVGGVAQYRKSPSLFELASQLRPRPDQQKALVDRAWNQVGQSDSNDLQEENVRRLAHARDEYRLARMLLESNSNPSARDQDGLTALMLAVISDNLSAASCLLEHGARVNDLCPITQMSALDFACAGSCTPERLKIVRLLIEKGADLDDTRPNDQSRLIDRLINEHEDIRNDKLSFIEMLLENGAKLGSSTWSAARGKHQIQLCLLKKLCQDGYFLYKSSSIEAAIYRFEYALRRIAELEQQIHQHYPIGGRQYQAIQVAARKIKYQTYLGLSRCEIKRKFFKRALEFAHMAILIDSTAYEAFYSKAHILKESGELDDSLLAVEQTSRLLERAMETLGTELQLLQQQEETLMLDSCIKMAPHHSAIRRTLIEAAQTEIVAELEHLVEARRFTERLKSDILQTN